MVLTAPRACESSTPLRSSAASPAILGQRPNAPTAVGAYGVRAAALFDHAPDRRGRAFESFVTCAFVLLLKETQSLVVKGRHAAFALEKSKAFSVDSLPGSQAQDLLQQQ